MDVREKLVELLDEAEEWADHKCDVLDCETCPADKMKGNCVQQLMVDRLIANGVTVQEEAKLYWKPVKPGEWNLTCSACDSHLGCREDASFCPECGAKFVYPKAVAPQPPKGE